MVFAVDSNSSFTAFLLDQDDLENDEDTLTKAQFDLQGDPVGLYLQQGTFGEHLEYL